VDIVPTILDLTGLEYPSIIDILPLEGQSFASILKEEPSEQERELFWEFRGHHAVRRGDWKLVAESGQDWELYDMSEDRVELENLVTQDPERVSKMASLYEDWAQRVGALTHEKCAQRGVSTQPR
jgi:arylsulfatase